MHRLVALSMMLIGAACGSPIGSTPPASNVTPAGPAVAPTTEPQPVAEAPCPEIPTGHRVIEATFTEQSRLDATLSAALAYGEEHPDTFGGHGLTWHADADASVVVAFTGHVDAHRTALAARVPHPDELIVCQAELAASEAEVIIDGIDAAYAGQLFAIGPRPFGGPVSVELSPTALDAAADLSERFGDRIVIRLGRYSYPVPTEAAECPAAIDAVGRSDVTVDVDAPTAPLVADAMGRVRIEAQVTNMTGAALTYDSQTGPAAVLLDATGRRVSAVLTEELAAAYFPVDIAAGETATIGFGSTIASCDPTLGYRLPPGEYTLQYRLSSMEGDPLVAGSVPVAIA